MSRSVLRPLFLALGLLAAMPVSTAAQDQLCDPGAEDCRAVLLNLIRNEPAGIDVGFWFMEDARYTTELIRRHQAGTPVRVLIDTRANEDYPLNAERLQELRSAGIPLRRRLTGNILHWKMMLFHGQGVVQFSGANYSANAWRPVTAVPFENFIDEAIYFTSDAAIVNSFRTRFDDQWVDTADWANYANISGPLARRYAIFPKDPSLNFAPWENFRTRSISHYNAEQRKIDVVMYRITDRAHTDSILNAVARGVQVRLITEPDQYRDASRMWHAWNVDRLYMGGVQIKHRAHQGLNHQKSVILYDQDPGIPGDQTRVIFGSSNWTSPSAAGQVEHNIFSAKPYLTSWLINQFERKWNNLGGVLENVDFVPLPPDLPKTPSPAHGAAQVAPAARLTWYGGPWAHYYDLYLDTTPNFTAPIAVNLAEPLSKTETSTFTHALNFPLRPNTTYYWRVVGKTMAMQPRVGPIWSFTTGGCPNYLSDVDADCLADITVFRPSTGTWYQRHSASGAASSLVWGGTGDKPVVGDFNGDGRADFAVFRPSNGTWYIRYAGTASAAVLGWGGNEDIPVAGDYDGDRWTDVAVYRPSTGTWFIRSSRTGAAQTLRLGGPGDVPVPGDYDGDRRLDIAVFRASTARWAMRSSADGRVTEVLWGAAGDIGVQGDYDGDGRTDVAVYRPSAGMWYVLRSSNHQLLSQFWGDPTDTPVPADYDGDGRVDFAIFRPSTGSWYVITSGSGIAYAMVWGDSGDIPISQVR